MTAQERRHLGQRSGSVGPGSAVAAWERQHNVARDNVVQRDNMAQRDNAA